MYGLLLDSIQKFLCEKYGQQRWEKIRRRANLKHMWFVTHEIYGEEVLLDLVKSASIELEEDSNTVMRMFGEYFARNIGHYGYARLLRVLGRDLRDFLNGLDDLHEYLRFSYPNMSPPSFFCEGETEHGLVLHYTSKRSGFLQYVIGQLTTVGRIYGKDLEIEVISEETIGQSITHFTLDLKFDNRELLRLRQITPLEKRFSVDASTFLGVFPFCILFDEDLLVWREGEKLLEVLPDLVGKHLENCFSIRKPMLPALSWRQICLHSNCVYELVSLVAVLRKPILRNDSDFADQSPPQPLRLKGQMLPLPQMKGIAFLCSPVIQSPEELYDNGIYVNDLSMHDSSRDVILAGSQRDPELNIALSQEKIRTAQLEESIQQTDSLLFQMIPKPIANQLRSGETPLNTCREFSSVSILFSDIVSFTPMCSRLHPMEVVCVLNTLYVAYDELCEEHSVYKLETIGDAYMVICGAPICTPRHAEHITGFAFAIIDATSKINDPSTSQPLRIRVGIHSGNVVAGVVGSTILRYDVFGDTVNVAARMEATGAPMKVHISEATANLLHNTAFTIRARGSVEVKGKGSMNTYWVTGKNASPDTTLRRRLSIPEPPPVPVTHRRPSPDKRAPYMSTSPSLQKAKLSLPSLFPKPDEWPQAKKQLQGFPIVDSVELGAARARRNTVAVIPPHSSLVGETSLREKHTHLPLSKVSSVPPNHGCQFASLGGCMPHQVEQNILSQNFGEETLRPDMAFDGSFSVPGSPYGAVQELEDFAFHAEETARQARQQAHYAEVSARQARKLADWASNLVQRLQLTQVADDEGSISGSTSSGDLRTASSDSEMVTGSETIRGEVIAGVPRTSGEGINAAANGATSIGTTTGGMGTIGETAKGTRGARTTAVPAGGVGTGRTIPGMEGTQEDATKPADTMKPPAAAAKPPAAATKPPATADAVKICRGEIPTDNARTPEEALGDGMGTPVDCVTPADYVETPVDGPMGTYGQTIANGTKTSTSIQDDMVASNSSVDASNQLCDMM